MESGRQVPGQQVGDAVDGVLSDAGEDRTEVKRRIEPVKLGGSNQGIEGSGSLAAGIRSKEKIVLPSNCNRPERPFGSTVVCAL